jgi:hypothetical protein
MRISAAEQNENILQCDVDWQVRGVTVLVMSAQSLWVDKRPPKTERLYVVAAAVRGQCLARAAAVV